MRMTILVCRGKQKTIRLNFDSYLSNMPYYGAHILGIQLPIATLDELWNLSRKCEQSQNFLLQPVRIYIDIEYLLYGLLEPILVGSAIVVF